MRHEVPATLMDPVVGQQRRPSAPRRDTNANAGQPRGEHQTAAGREEYRGVEPLLEYLHEVAEALPARQGNQAVEIGMVVEQGCGVHIGEKGDVRLRQQTAQGRRDRQTQNRLTQPVWRDEGNMLCRALYRSASSFDRGHRPGFYSLL